jgi:3alpha(or 20beta)-hydroxysteroid dehydrogenase
MGRRLADKVAIVTGASSGQGAATARLFAAEGARVMLTDLNEPAAAMLQSLGEEARFLRHDVSDAEI